MCVCVCVGDGRVQGIGLVGNLAKKQSTDLLCCLQAWEPAHMNLTPPLTHSLPAKVLFSVCGHVETVYKKEEQFRLWQTLCVLFYGHLCIFLCGQKNCFFY